MKNSVFVGREFLLGDVAGASRKAPRCVLRGLAILLAFAVAFSAPPLSHAQTGGALAGEVSDASKSVLTDVTVTATAATTGQVQTVKTNENGLYRFPLLTPGSYEVTFILSGFKELRAKATVVVSETATLDAVLPVGGVNEQVEVSAADNSALLQTDTSTLGRVVDEKTVQEVPLSTRNFTQLMTLSPGTSSNVNNAGSLGRGTQTIYANGARAVSNSLTIDGIDAINIHSNGLAENSVSSNGVAVPSPEAIQEFKVQTGMYDAQYGRNGGANTALVTRTGTSRFHGSIYEFFRNDALNANTFLFRQNGTKRAVLKQNQFGVSLGGPVIAEKMFFFASYQGTRQVNGLAGSKTLSLPSGLYGSTRTAAALGAAYGGKTGSNGGLAIANDGSNISPVALALLNYKLPNGQYVIPSPQSSATTNNYSVSIPSRYTEDQWVATIDHSFSASNHFTVRGLLANQPQFNSFTTATVAGFGQTQDFKSRAFNLTDVHVFSPRVVNEAHAGLMRIMGALGVENVIPIGSIGMSRFNSSIFNNIPTIAVSGSSGTFTLGYSTDGNQAGHQNTFQYTDTVSVIEGKHSVRIGAELRRYQDNYNTYNRTLGTITLYSFPDFLLGRSSGSVASGGNGLSTYGALSNASVASNIGVRNDRLTDYTLFVQDDWKISRKLTFNAGLRWDRYGSGVDQGGRNGNFVPSLYTAPPSGGYTSAGFVQSANARKLLNGVPTVNPRLLSHEMWKNFAPRVGFSYQALSSIVVRGGYGIFFDRLSNQISLRTALAPPNYIKSDLSGTNANGASLANPFPVLPLPSALPTTPLLPDPFTFPASSLLATNAVDPNMGMPYMHQYVGNVQWEARKSLLLEVGYVGSKGVKLPNQMYINQARIASASTPVNGVTTTTTASANLAQRVPFLGMSPNGLTYLMTNTDSRYNSLQVSVTKRLSHGLQFLASYTYSRSVDDSSGSSGSTFVNSDGDQIDVHQATGRSDFDRPRRFVVNYIYDVPYLGYHLQRNGFTNALFADWQLTGVTTLQDGSPFDLTDANGAAYYGTGTSRASFASGKTIADAKKDGSVTSRYKAYFNTSAFANAGNYYGNVSRNALRGPGQANWDFAALKSFQLFEGVRFQFRSEFFNVFNHTNFANPSSAISSSSSFGVISSIIGNPRVIQFAGKVTF